MTVGVVHEADRIRCGKRCSAAQPDTGTGPVRTPYGPVFLQCLQVESGFTVDAIQRIELRIWLDDDFFPVELS
nr:hypothetical protein [Escherichia coli]